MKHRRLVFGLAVVTLLLIVLFFAIRSRSQNNVVAQFLDCYYKIADDSRYQEYQRILDTEITVQGDIGILSEDGIKAAQAFFAPYFTKTALGQFTNSHLFLRLDRQAYLDGFTVRLTNCHIQKTDSTSSVYAYQYTVETTYTTSKGDSVSETWYLDTVLSEGREEIASFRVVGEH